MIEEYQEDDRETLEVVPIFEFPSYPLTERIEDITMCDYNKAR